MARGKIQRKKIFNGRKKRIESERLNNISWAEERLKSQHKMKYQRQNWNIRNICLCIYIHTYC